SLPSTLTPGSACVKRSTPHSLATPGTIPQARHWDLNAVAPGFAPSTSTCEADAAAGATSAKMESSTDDITESCTTSIMLPSPRVPAVVKETSTVALDDGATVTRPDGELVQLPPEANPSHLGASI